MMKNSEIIQIYTAIVSIINSQEARKVLAEEIPAKEKVVYDLWKDYNTLLPVYTEQVEAERKLKMSFDKAVESYQGSPEAPHPMELEKDLILLRDIEREVKILTLGRIPEEVVEKIQGFLPTNALLAVYQYLMKTT